MITIIHPSRNRPEQALKTFVHWMSLAEKPDNIEYILSIDADDMHLNKYINSIKAIKSINSNKNCVEAVNAGAKLSTGNILIVVSDDFKCFQGWDRALEDAFYQQSPGKVLKTFDGVQKWIVTLPIMDRTYYLKQGYIYFPQYQHMFCDTDMTHKAEIENKLIYRLDLEFRHDHYSTGAVAKDSINEKADSTWNQGEEIYLERIKNKFGLEGIEDVWKLNSEAAAHINWCKQKLKI